MKLDEFEKKIGIWAEKRGLIHVDNVPKQMMKTVEEFGELSSAILKKKHTETIDGLGDTLVCLFILAKQLDLTIEECITHAYDEIKDRTGRTIDGNFIKKEDL